MGIRLYTEPQLEQPDMVASWPGIGNVGVIAADTLRGQIQAETLGEIDAWEFFYPTRVLVKDGMLKELDFPGNRFYYKRTANKDVIFFIGEEQPASSGGAYAEGSKAYLMGNLVLDVAQKFGCRRIYTSGAAVSLTHHTLRPRVWAVTNSNELNREVKSHENTILMGDVEGSGEWGSITGLNGLLLGLAKKRGFEAICLMGELPDYLSRAPFPYPRASKSVLEVLTSFMGIKIDFAALDAMAVQVDEVIEGIYKQLPPEVRERIEQRKTIIPAKPDTITKEDAEWIKGHIDELFKKEGGGNERPA